jgi:hypothetical protein
MISSLNMYRRRSTIEGSTFWQGYQVGAIFEKKNFEKKLSYIYRPEINLINIGWAILESHLAI